VNEFVPKKTKKIRQQTKMDAERYSQSASKKKTSLTDESDRKSRGKTVRNTRKWKER